MSLTQFHDLCAPCALCVCFYTRARAAARRRRPLDCFGSLGVCCKMLACCCCACYEGDLAAAYNQANCLLYGERQINPS